MNATETTHQKAMAAKFKIFEAQDVAAQIKDSKLRARLLKKLAKIRNDLEALDNMITFEER